MNDLMKLRKLRIVTVYLNSLHTLSLIILVVDNFYSKLQFYRVYRHE